MDSLKDIQQFYQNIEDRFFRNPENTPRVPSVSAFGVVPKEKWTKGIFVANTPMLKDFMVK